jgi:hypothetical protein
LGARWGHKTARFSSDLSGPIFRVGGPFPSQAQQADANDRALLSWGCNAVKLALVPRYMMSGEAIGEIVVPVILIAVDGPGRRCEGRESAVESLAAPLYGGGLFLRARHRMDLGRDLSGCGSSFRDWAAEWYARRRWPIPSKTEKKLTTVVK